MGHINQWLGDAISEVVVVSSPCLSADVNNYILHYPFFAKEPDFPCPALTYLTTGRVGRAGFYNFEVKFLRADTTK